jgi:hypothetical protein
MPAKSKPAAAKKHTNPKGRVAFFCYVGIKTLKLIKSAVKSGAQSQGHVVDAAVHGTYKRPIA